MYCKCIRLGVAVLLCLNCVAFADRTLEKPEILEIFDTLTSQTRVAWISAGTIEAVHDEYRAAKTTNQDEINNEITQEIEKYRDTTSNTESTKELQEMMLDAIPFNVRYELSNEYSMSSYVVLRYDGERFYWGISVKSRSNSVIPDADLKDNYMTEEFNMDWNTDRIFAWDGQKYSIYSLSANNAVVDTTNEFPHVVNGPLTAGIIPWCSGSFTYDALTAGELSAIEVNINGRTEIHLKTIVSNGSEMLFILDPEKKYAVLSCLFTGQDYIVARQYDDFKLVSGNWVPMTILVEKYDNSTEQLLSSDFWKFTNISSEMPSSGSFSVDYLPNALISYRYSADQPPLVYQYAKDTDIEQSLVRSLDLAGAGSAVPQNCATAALGYAARQLEKEIMARQLSKLVVGPDNTTSLYAMKKLAQELGLYSRVIKTDLETLKSMSDSKAILHIPGKEHFVVLDHVDDRHVWLVDLTAKRFFYSVEVDDFGKQWTEGTAMLVSSRPIELRGNSTEITDAGLQRLVGAAEGSSCTLLLQEFDMINCIQIAGQCLGYYEVIFTRYGCEPAESGTCAEKLFIRRAKDLCINDPYNPMYCTIEGNWIIYLMYACK
ncbi:MAG: hypothetical protein JW715_06010 [Sedimentisphaerales bacterium]|nr:hypothetical protein [Sedimentisphaerales bacterium]